MYWLVGATAVALTAGVWFRLASPPGAPSKDLPQLAAYEQAATPAAPAPPSPALSVLRKLLPEHAKRAHAGDRAALTAFYGASGARLLWVSESGLNDKGKAALAEIRRADDWGLRAADFAVPQPPAGDLAPEAAAEAELAVTLALLKYARHARGGRLGDPSRISKLLDHTPPVRAPKLVLTELAAAEAPDAYLRALHPKHEQFEKLRQLLLRLRAADAGDAVGALPSTAAEGDLAYGEKLQDAVPALQRAGIPAPQPAARDSDLQPSAARAGADIDRILVNMERWRWMPADLGTLYVWSNVPEFLTRVVKDGKILNSDRIVAGQPAWPTPAFSADMKTIVFHPSWGVPDGIKRKELAPLLRKSSGGGLIGLFTGAPSSQAVLEAHNLQAYYRGRQIDPNQVDWGSANIGAYDFRQPPGPRNVLGDVKFMFPNKHDVYMHDTPERDLFARSFRGLSHGCMRVGDPRRLAEILLAEDKGWPKEKVASLFGRGTQEVTLSTHIPVHVTYFTAMVDYEGNLRTFGDLYGLDARVGAALFGRRVRFETPRYDNEVMALQEDRRRQAGRGQSGSSTLTDALADIFNP